MFPKEREQARLDWTVVNERFEVATDDPRDLTFSTCFDTTIISGQWVDTLLKALDEYVMRIPAHTCQIIMTRKLVRSSEN
jgi:hypothetical protein